MPVLRSSSSSQKFSLYRRLRQRREFEEAFLANRQQNQWFVVYFRKTGLGASRLGMVISKKITPKATARNRIRRLVREEFRKTFPAVCSIDIVVRARRSVTIEDVAAGRQALRRALRTIHECCNEP